MSLRRYDPKLLDDIVAVAAHLEGERVFLRDVLEIVQRSARKGRAAGDGQAKHFALKEIEALCSEAMVRTDRKPGGTR